MMPIDTTNNNHSSMAAFLWSVADLLRGDFKQSQYGRIILPFTLLRRLECVLETSKPDVLQKYEAVKAMPFEAQDKLLTHAAQLSFYNTSKMDLNHLGETDVASNLESYIQSFSPNAREIFEHFDFFNTIDKLEEADLLYKVINIEMLKQSKSAKIMGEACICIGTYFKSAECLVIKHLK